MAELVSYRAKPLVLTMGDPAGIGGELTLLSWKALRETGPGFAVIDDPERLAQVDPAVPLIEVEGPEAAMPVFARALPVIPLRLARPSVAGRPDPANGPATIASIEQATRLVQQGRAAAVVTNPISKAVLYEAGFAYPGHTEYLAALTETIRPIMMLACRDLRVVPVTIHVSLRQALDTLTTEAIVEAGRITEAALRRDFAIAAPRLAIAGLNPHAGEQGSMGREEITLIAPAIAALRQAGIEVSGPWPPDTMFTMYARARYDAAICMYHDQALIPLKTIDVAGGVNVTLGLPIVRTSPDHGTAFDIAGTGRADPSSLIQALRMAAELARSREAAA